MHPFACAQRISKLIMQATYMPVDDVSVCMAKELTEFICFAFAGCTQDAAQYSSGGICPLLRVTFHFAVYLQDEVSGQLKLCGLCVCWGWLLMQASNRYCVATA